MNFIRQILPSRARRWRILILAGGAGLAFAVQEFGDDETFSEYGQTALLIFCAAFVVQMVAESLTTFVEGMRIEPPELAGLVRIANRLGSYSTTMPTTYALDELGYWIQHEEGGLAAGDEVHTLTSDLRAVDGRDDVRKTVAANIKGGATYHYYVAKSSRTRAAARDLYSAIELLSGESREVLSRRLVFHELGIPAIFHFSYVDRKPDEPVAQWYLLTPSVPGSSEGRIVVHEFAADGDDLKEILDQLRRNPRVRKFDPMKRSKGEASTS